ncbi:MAG: peptidase M15 [Alphaproteobacteria bacterium]|nr:peptidase M15 [Alphaproteobacteria bacterium]
MRWRSAAAILACAACGCAGGPARPVAGFVDASDATPGLVIDMRYASSDNFVGRPINGYGAPRCLLTPLAAEALAGAQARLAPFGLGLKAFDCYRPQRAVDEFVAWANDPSDTSGKDDYYPGVDKSALFDEGYIAARSGHSRGSTVDIALVDLETGAPLDMGGDWDFFDPVSWPSATGIPASARAHRLLLRAVMIEAGFRPYEKEWWHFTLENEPFPDTYFDIPLGPR